MNTSENDQINISSSHLLHSIKNDTLAAITRAMVQSNIITLTYNNPFTGTKDRTFAPNCLVTDGLRWHVRGYCRLREQFIDLVLSRIENVQDCELPKNENTEGIMSDRQWNRFIDLEIVPHPNIPNPQSISYEHCMTNGMLKIEKRAAVVGYFLRSWGVDCTKDHSLNEKEYHLWLRNTPALYGASNARIAPGYSEDL